MRKKVGVIGTAVSTTIALQFKNSSSGEYYVKGQCFVELSNTRVRPISLLSTDRFRSLPDNEVRHPSSVNVDSNADHDHSLSFGNGIEMRFKRMEEEIRYLREEQERKDEEHEKKFKNLDTENRKLRQRLAAMENSTEQDTDGLGVQDTESSGPSFEPVKVNAIKLGAVPLVLFTMARECVGETAVDHRSATRRHREQHSSNYSSMRWVGSDSIPVFLPTSNHDAHTVVWHTRAFPQFLKEDIVTIKWNYYIYFDGMKIREELESAQWF
eukprot:gene836-153_t